MIDGKTRALSPASPNPLCPATFGLGPDFAFPFVTIEDVVVFGRKRIGVLNDNNFPFSVGRHVGSGQPDDNEFIIIELDQPLHDVKDNDQRNDDEKEDHDDDDHHGNRRR